MSRELLETLGAHEAEVVAILTPLYAEVRHWERELANARKAKRAVAIAMEARQRPDREAGLDPKGDSAGPQDIAQTPSEGL